MKILVDKLPNTCGECQFCAEAVMMSPLGVQKQVNLCTVTTSLIPQNPQEPPKTLEKEKTPIENDCIFSDKTGEAGKIILGE